MMGSETLIPNTSMVSGYDFTVGVQPALEIKSVMLSNISVNQVARKRPLDRANIDVLKDAIKSAGLLQPIGVVRGDMTKGEPPLTLVWGFHRFTAMVELTAEAQARGEMTGGAIPAVVFAAGTPRWQMEMAEVMENLHRKELNAAERAAHTLLYAGLLKKAGVVATANEKKAQAGEKGNVAQGKSKGRTVTSGASASPRPTATEAVAKDLGISKKQVHERVRKAVASVGADPVSVEKADADVLIDLGRKAVAKAPEEHKRRRAENGTAMKSAQQERRGARSDPGAVAFVVGELRALEASSGVGVLKEAINQWWKEAHPQGRVPFQTTSK